MSYDEEPDCDPREATPLVSIQLPNWPPAGLDAKALARLLALISRDFKKTLLGAARARRGVARTSVKRSMAAAAAPADSEETGKGVDCKMTGWGYEIVEINGVPTRCRVEYYLCSDGSSFRREYPL